MNLLLTSIGSFSAKFVIEQCKLFNVNIIGIDINDAKYLFNSKLVDTFYKVPLTVNTKLYIDAINKIIKNCSVTHIIPLTDTDVDFYAEYSNLFESFGVKILVERQSLIKLIRNKKSVFETFRNNELISCIPTFSINEYVNRYNQYPAIAKIENGRSSQFLMHIDNDKQIPFLSNENYVIQPKIEGDVITADIINYNGICNWIQRKEIIRTSNGAGLTVEIVNNKLVSMAIEEFIKLTNYVGILNIEFIVNKYKVYLMDINPRFSAGVAFSNMAGYNFVRNAINILNNNDIEPLENELPIGLIITKEYYETTL